MDHQHYSKKDSYSPFREQKRNPVHITTAEKTAQYAQIQRINQQHGNRDLIKEGFEYFEISFTDLRRC